MTTPKRDTEYTTRLKLHLARYKREVLDIAEDGLWSGRNVSRPHILPSELKWANILPVVREDFQAFFASGAIPSFTLHRDFHHVNSSQAMAFNLIFPWFRHGMGGQFIEAIGCGCDGVEEWHFEHVPDPAEFTNLDFWIRQPTGREVHIEVKLTEREFGTVAPRSAVHIQKLSAVYRPRLLGKIDPRTEDALLLEHYQLMRIVSGLSRARGDQAVILAPASNRTLTRQFHVFHDLLLPVMKDRVRLVSLEDLVASLAYASQDSSLLATVRSEFARKYLPDSQ